MYKDRNVDYLMHGDIQRKSQNRSNQNASFLYSEDDISKMKNCLLDANSRIKGKKGGRNLNINVIDETQRTDDATLTSEKRHSLMLKDYNDTVALQEREEQITRARAMEQKWLGI